MKLTQDPQHLPINCRTLVRLLVVVIVVLSFLAGYYHAALVTEQARSAYLETQLQSL